MSGIYINPSNNNSLNLSGGTVSGQTMFTGGLSANTFSAGTINSGSTNLYSIFQPIGASGGGATIQPGLNTYTGGTSIAPTVNISAATLSYLSVSGNSNIEALTANTFIAATISGGTITSGGTDLYNIFITQLDGNDITRVQPGSNITTGGSANFPVINLIASPSINNLIASGNTNLQSLTATTFIATTISGGTITSGGTDLYNIFLTTADGNDITRVQPGLNTYTGGTDNSPSINVSALTINTLTASGNTSLQAMSATTVSASTLTAGTLTVNSIVAAGSIQAGSTVFGNQGQFNSIQPFNSGLINLTLQTRPASFADIVFKTSGTTPIESMRINSAGTVSLINLIASGNTTLAALTATTISASTVTSPLIYGSSSSSGALTIDSTSNTTKGPINFGSASGNNSYYFNVGSATTVFTVREKIGSIGQGALYLAVAPGSETSTNYALNWNGALQINSQSSIATLSFKAGDVVQYAIQPAGSTSNSYFQFSARARTSLITAAQSVLFDVQGSTQTWAAGTIPSQYFGYFRANTIAFASASSATTLTSLAVEHTKLGSNASAGTASALYIPQGTYSATTIAYGILIDTVTGATTNYSLGVGGDAFITGNTITNTLSAATITATTLTAATIVTTNFSAFTNSVSGVSVFNTSGGTPVWSVNTTLGRVGISNASPGHTLDVNGNINARHSISQIGGYYINGNSIVQQGPTGYGNNIFLFGASSSNGYNIFNSLPFGIGVSGNSLVLRNAFTVGQAFNGFGSIQTLTGATIITGTGTNFLTTLNVGDTIRFGSNNYTVSAITTDTSLTITTTAQTTSASSTYFVPGGEKFYIASNGNVRSHSNSISGFTVLHQSGGTPVFNVDTKNLRTSINGGLTITSGITANTFFNDTEQIYGNVIKSTPPINTGNTWVRSIDYEEFIYDAIRAKWLSNSEQRLTGAKASNSATTQFLSYEDGLFFSTTPFRIPYDSTITKIVMAGVSADTWQAFVTTGSSMSTDFIATLGVSANIYSARTDYNVNVLSGQTLYLGFSGTSVNQPRVDIYFKRRGQ